jgi:MOSC domain-containing protein YiiM
MRILQVCAGGARQTPTDGRSVLTAIVKRTVEGAVAVVPAGL